MTYRDAMLGELRLFECFGINHEFPNALTWTPRARMRYRASMLAKVSELGEVWGTGMMSTLRWIMRRSTRAMNAMLLRQTYCWFDDVPEDQVMPGAGVEHTP